MADKIEDFGEKIGGARKDRARKTGKRVSKAAPKVPNYVKQYVALENRFKPGEWYLFKKPRGRSGMVGRRVGGPFPSESVANAAKPLAAVSANYTVSANSRGPDGALQYEIVRKTTRGYVPAADGAKFASREEGLKYIAANVDELLSARPPRGYGEELLRQAKVTATERVGPRIRSGDVTPEQFMKRYAPKGVEFGNWEEGARRQKLINATYDALQDLADAVGVQPKQLMVGKQLGVSFGARGHGGMNRGSATYHPDYGTMNMTKPRGAGALAHEWFHALDHTLGRVDDPALAQRVTNAQGDTVWKTFKDSSHYASERVSGRAKVAELPAPVREAMRDLVDTMRNSKIAEVEDVTALRPAADRSAKRVDQTLSQIREVLAKPVGYRKRKAAGATSEQLRRFDEIASKIKSGQAQVPEWSFAGDPKARMGSRGSMVFRYRSAELDSLNDLFKEVRGFSGHGKDGRSGPLVDLAHGIKQRQDLSTRIANAQAGKSVARQGFTEFYKSAKALDKTRTSPYWSQNIEMFARAGEAYVHDKLAAQGRVSPYLVGGAENSFEAAEAAMSGGLKGSPKPYPEGIERKTINSKFDRLFEALRAEKLPAGWSDEAREASAEVRKAKAKGGVKKPAAPKSDLPKAVSRMGKRHAVKTLKDGTVQLKARGEPAFTVKRETVEGLKPWEPKTRAKKAADPKLVRRGGDLRKARVDTYGVDTSQVKTASLKGEKITDIRSRLQQATRDGQINLIDPKQAADFKVTKFSEAQKAKSYGKPEALAKLEFGSTSPTKEQLDAFREVHGKTVTTRSGHKFKSTWYRPPTLAGGEAMQPLSVRETKYKDWIKAGKPKGFFSSAGNWIAPALGVGFGLYALTKGASPAQAAEIGADVTTMGAVSEYKYHRFRGRSIVNAAARAAAGYVSTYATFGAAPNLTSSSVDNRNLQRFRGVDTAAPGRDFAAARRNMQGLRQEARRQALVRGKLKGGDAERAAASFAKIGKHRRRVHGKTVVVQSHRRDLR